MQNDIVLNDNKKSKTVKTNQDFAARLQRPHRLLLVDVPRERTVDERHPSPALRSAVTHRQVLATDINLNVFTLLDESGHLQ